VVANKNSGYLICWPLHAFKERNRSDTDAGKALIPLPIRSAKACTPPTLLSNTLSRPSRGSNQVLDGFNDVRQSTKTRGQGTVNRQQHAVHLSKTSLASRRSVFAVERLIRNHPLEHGKCLLWTKLWDLQAMERNPRCSIASEL
jgi:hypothetical protein